MKGTRVPVRAVVELSRLYPSVVRLCQAFPVLNAAAEIIFLVAGADKAEALRQVLDASSAAEKFPAQRVRPAEGQVRWYVDEAAARLL